MIVLIILFLFSALLFSWQFKTIHEWLLLSYYIFISSLSTYIYIYIQIHVEIYWSSNIYHTDKADGQNTMKWNTALQMTILMPAAGV